MTFYVLLIATTLAGSWTMAHVSVIQDEPVRQALAYDPGWKAFLASFVLALLCLVAWYVVPGLDTALFRVIALSVSGIGTVLFIVYYIQVFQRHLETS